MRPPPTTSRSLASGLVLVLLTAGCGVGTRQTLLHTFFTGLEEPEPAPVRAAAIARTNAVVVSAIPDGPVMHMHQPYLDRQCVACHLSGQSESLRAPEPGLCLECHPKFAGTAVSVHAPFAEGKCAVCHDSHSSPEPFLLVRPGQALCLSCHPAPIMADLPAHVGSGGGPCLSCHDPHRSDQKTLVRARP